MCGAGAEGRPGLGIGVGPSHDAASLLVAVNPAPNHVLGHVGRRAHCRIESCPARQTSAVNLAEHGAALPDVPSLGYKQRCSKVYWADSEPSGVFRRYPRDQQRSADPKSGRGAAWHSGCRRSASIAGSLVGSNSVRSASRPSGLAASHGPNGSPTMGSPELVESPEVVGSMQCICVRRGRSRVSAYEGQPSDIRRRGGAVVTLLAHAPFGLRGTSIRPTLSDVGEEAGVGGQSRSRARSDCDIFPNQLPRRMPQAASRASAMRYEKPEHRAKVPR